MKETKKMIPGNEKGIETNTESNATFSNDEEGKQFFAAAKNRLLNVNSWHEFAGSATANFQLTDENGNEVNRGACKGDFIKIDIPGPGSKTGKGSDWVRVEAVNEINNSAEQSIIMRVRPAANPKSIKRDVAHFFSADATSSFEVKREKGKITAAVYGRNEKPNTGVSNIPDKIRNAVVAAGAISGFSKIQWKSLVNGFIKKMPAK